MGYLIKNSGYPQHRIENVQVMEESKKASDGMKFNVEIVCTDNSKVTEEKLYGYVLRAIASVVANNCGIITSMSLVRCDEKEQG